MNTSLPQSRTETKTEISMKKLMETLDPKSLRFQALNSAARFKSNWLDLGELLHGILKSEQFREWGYETFEEYSKVELKIKLDTAMKLVGSFGYLKKFKPSITAPDSLAPVPDFKVINKLMEAESNPNLKEDDFKTLRHSVFDEGISSGGLKKQIQTLSGTSEPPMDDEERLLEKLKFSVNTIKKLIRKFDPADEVLDAVSSIEDFISRLEV